MSLRTLQGWVGVYLAGGAQQVVPTEVSDLPLFLVKFTRKGPFHNTLKQGYVSREQSSQYFAYDKTKSIIPAHN